VNICLVAGALYQERCLVLTPPGGEAAELCYAVAPCERECSMDNKAHMHCTCHGGAAFLHAFLIMSDAIESGVSSERRRVEWGLGRGLENDES
jgi:hypothetical protein